jgi:4-diphosphocytidyl-2-C-methyl-D-erythritol kinase
MTSPATGRPVQEIARAKVNLTLSILGRRPEGYHELDSLVAFAGIGDGIEFRPGEDPTVSVVGPFADVIVGRNLASVALDACAAAEPRLTLGSVVIDKRLPVAAGLGGGSSDAAAVLRAVRAANPTYADSVDWTAIAAGLGADVTVCFENRPARMQGIGERVLPLSRLPAVPAVLVNPMVEVPADKTRSVYRALAAPPVSEVGSETPLPMFETPADVIAHARRAANDLEPPACAVVPTIAEVMAALSELPGVALVRLSGSGPTVFALFHEVPAATAAAKALAARQPDWWVVATVIGETA